MEGQLISGRYRLEAVLGRGGMATVWRGVDERIGRPVAVKLLDRADATDPTILQRFDREARTAGRLTHANIVAVYDVGSDNGMPYLVMELVDGTSLAGSLAGGPLPIDRAVGIAHQICDALAAAHTQGVVHRDIKPANILLTTTGTVKVCDFGIARLTEQRQADLTAPHSAIGTSAYMAPEQAGGAAVDARTDLYALGCVLYAMLTGHPPFTGDNPLTVLWQHQHQPAPSAASLRPDTPPELDVLLSRLLAKDPADRPGTAAEVRDRLAAPATGPAAAAASARAVAPVLSRTRILPVLDRPDPPAAPVGGRFRLGPAGVAAAALSAAILTALAVALLFTSNGTGTDATSTGTGSPPAATTAGPAGDPRTDPPGGIAGLRAVIEEQRQAGNLDRKRAEELTKKLDDVDRELSDGDSGKAAEKLADLRKKVDELHRDDKLGTPAYEALQARLSQLADTLPPAEKKDDDG